VKVEKYVRVHVWTECARVLAGDCVDQLVYSMVANYLAPATLSFSPSELDGQIRDGWVDWVKTNVPEFAKMMADGAADVRGAVESAIKVRKAEIDDEKKGKLSDEELARREVQKNINADKAHVNAVEKKIVQAVSEAFDGTVPPERFMGLVEHIAKEMGVKLPDSFGFDPLTATKNDVMALCMLLFKNGRIEALREMAARASKLVAALDAAGLDAA